jgi:hypothetical protein
MPLVAAGRPCGPSLVGTRRHQKDGECFGRTTRCALVIVSTSSPGSLMWRLIGSVLAWSGALVGQVHGELKADP